MGDKAFLYGVQPEDIDDFWPALLPLIEKPLLRHGEIKNFSPDDIRALMHKEIMQCWASHDGENILAVAVTQINNYPQRSVLAVILAGAETGTIDQWVGYMEVFKEFAKAHNCEAVLIDGREGWRRVFKPKTVHTVFELEV